MNEDVVALVLVFGTLAWVIWVLFSSIRRYTIARLRTDLQSRLLDKFGSGQELVAYIQTREGREFLGRLSADPLLVAARILDAVQAGYLLTIVGVALLILQRWIAEASEALLVFGVLSLALGLGFWATAWHTQFLAKRFNVLHETRDDAV